MLVRDRIVGLGLVVAWVVGLIAPGAALRAGEEVRRPLVDVRHATEAGRLRKIDWPDRWHVFGPLPPAFTMLPPSGWRPCRKRWTLTAAHTRLGRCRPQTGCYASCR
jgi:hypothetical protein